MFSVVKAMMTGKSNKNRLSNEKLGIRLEEGSMGKANVFRYLRVNTSADEPIKDEVNNRIDEGKLVGGVKKISLSIEELKAGNYQSIVN